MDENDLTNPRQKQPIQKVVLMFLRTFFGLDQFLHWIDFQIHIMMIADIRIII